MMHREQALSTNDCAVLCQIFDPEAAPAPAVLVDPSLPAEPYIEDPQMLASIRTKEKKYVAHVETVLKSRGNLQERSEGLSIAYRGLTDLIDAHPQCGSLRNNRAQLSRLQYGDHELILQIFSSMTHGTAARAITALSDLSLTISLLSPLNPQSAVSPAQCRTLAQAHTQRGALYHAASRYLASQSTSFTVMSDFQTSIEELQGWAPRDFEQAASRDFFLGGHYGSEVGKVLAVYTNPTAKLCGQVVKEAMMREFSASMYDS